MPPDPSRLAAAGSLPSCSVALPGGGRSCSGRPLADRWIAHSAGSGLDEAGRRRHNAIFERDELARCADFFNHVLPQPLNPEQRAAIIVDEDATLVVAAAGSGKTTLLLGKIAYLLMRGLARPQEIVFLAFNQSVRTEVRQRLASTCPGVAVHTFHSLGLDIVRRTSAEPVRLSALAADADGFRAFVREVLRVRAGSEPALMAEWLVADFRPPRGDSIPREPRQRAAWLRRHPSVTLLGSRVAGEPLREAADRLTLAGIRYRVDASLPCLPGLPNYRPQLWLPEARLAIDLEDAGGDPVQRASGGGGSGSRVTRLVHEWLARLACLRHRVRRVRLAGTARLQGDGRLGQALAATLSRQGLDLRPRALGALAACPGLERRLDHSAALFATCVTLHKGAVAATRAADPDRESVASSPETRRRAAFDAIFEGVLAAYQTQMEAHGEIDFNDMIARAVDSLDQGAATVPFRYLLVDEFQDISAGRAALIHALRRSRPGMRLVAVGDDWQSIYRFAGSDVSIMTGFERHFGPTELRFLRQTFRFDRNLECIASAFVLRNPAQIRKQVEAREPLDEASPVVLWMPRESESGHPLSRIIEDLMGSPPAAFPASPEVLVLARYRALLQGLPLAELASRHPQVRWRCSTIHRAKGATADCVVLLGVCGGRQPFPAERDDDPLLQTFLGAAEPFPHAEERRLFYVALTRARHRVYVVGDHHRPSPFCVELEALGADVSRSEHGG